MIFEFCLHDLRNLWHDLRNTEFIMKLSILSEYETRDLYYRAKIIEASALHTICTSMMQRPGGRQLTHDSSTVGLSPQERCQGGDISSTRSKIPMAVLDSRRRGALALAAHRQ